MLKRLAIMVMVVGLIIGSFGLGVQAEASFKIEGEGAVLMDPATGEILFEQDGDKKWYPASMTKVMTMGLILEALAAGQISLEDEVITSENAAGYGGAQVFLEPGEVFTLNEMLIAISVGSANDASVAVAEYFSGTEAAFAQLMTEKAKELGANNTNFMNSHGLHHDNHYTTPKDMTIISNWAMSLPKMLEYTSIKEYTFRDEPKLLILYNTNKLLWWYPGTTGLKTGTTSAAKRNLSATVERNGLELLGTVMGVDRSNGHFGETMKLFNWGFANYKYEKLYSQGEIVTEIRVSKGMEDNLSLYAEDNIGALLEKQDKNQLETEFILPNYITAPIAKDEKIGSVKVLKNQKEIVEISLLAKKEIAKSSFWHLFTKTLNKTFSL